MDRIDEVESLLNEMIEGQRQRLLELARRIDPDIAPDDLLQPHDFPRLASHPTFQFEDGILAGYLAVQTAWRTEKGRR